MGLFTLIILCACLLGSTVATAPPDPNRGNCPQISPGDVSDNQSRGLIVLVPNITTYQLFVNCSDPNNVTGFCIDVFESVLSDLCDGMTPTISYVCFDFLNSTTKLTYDDMVHVLTYNRSYDAVVGDITIAAKRIAMADFSQPYLESGIVILTLATKQGYYSALTFFTPFTVRMWCTILGAFFFTGFFLWMLERDSHPEFREGGLEHWIYSVCGFVGSSLILMQRDSIKSPIAQLLMVFWVIFGLFLGSSYTAGLTSILTAEKLSPKVQDINSLTSTNVQIGYRKDSNVKEYLMNRLKIQERRLKPLKTQDDFIQALSNESVAAVFDEVPYVNMLLSSLSPSECNYEVIGSQFTTEGFGFAFPFGSNLASQSSKSILNLSESGKLKMLQDKVNVSPQQCSPQLEYAQITASNSASLYICLGGLLLACVVIHYAKKYHNISKTRVQLLRCMRGVSKE